MRYQHNFGSFHESVRVDGEGFTFESFSKIDTAAERNAFRKMVVDRVVKANRAKSAECGALTQPIRVEYKAKRDAFLALPRFAKRYRGRAADERRGINDLRYQERNACDAVIKDVKPVDGRTYPAAVHDVFSVWESKLETDFERFERMVSGHDWYYEYSDDHRYWTAGCGQSAAISALLKKLGEPAQALYNEKCPWLNADGSRKEA